MSIINVNKLTFSYDTHHENIFTDTSFTLDTDWKLGLIGRNGRGKTTFLNLLQNKYEYKGSIVSSVSSFDYFPFEVDSDGITLEVIRNVIAPYAQWEAQMEQCIALATDDALQMYGDILENYMQHDGYSIEDLIVKEINLLHVDADVLKRPFKTLSNGERTKLMLAALFLKKNNFLLIDEPTNHLDQAGREILAQYLYSKNGFILVSHDRLFLDRVIDHVVSINRQTIEVVKGNYTSWYTNKQRQDQYERNENSKLKKEISRLQASSSKAIGCSDNIESKKLGTDIVDKGYAGHKSAKMMKRAKVIEGRKNRLVEESSKLLKDVETVEALKIHYEPYIKPILIEMRNIQIHYGEREVVNQLNLRVLKGQRLLLKGKNGCGKSSLIKLIMNEVEQVEGHIIKGSKLKISYVPQDTSFLKGDMKTFILYNGIDESLFKAILRKLDFSRDAFDKQLEELSGGQKKKVLIAKSLSEQAHLYIWDEPLNFIDILSRQQIEDLLVAYEPTMVFVEHDQMFCEQVATNVLDVSNHKFN
ncbi:MAG: Lsa family ABC-F type ribosomal protection protein [Epulopiscium sp. Nuni2H_MBin001]|nr:MAG: Lsa family ABC-F type ribosomal protection protein [Epulopiscium sp. Nuni2H_MBin001]